MNILEAYIKKYDQIIILILGLPCTNKSEIAKEFEIDLKLPILNINDYIIPDKFKEITINDIKFKIYEDSDNYDWKKLNDDIEKLKSSGIILYGNYLDSHKIDFNYDFSFFYSMNSTLCKNILVEKNMLNEITNSNHESEVKLKIYFENIFNPFYENLKKDIKFNKFYNIKENTTFDNSYDDVFDLLMKLIGEKLTSNKLKNKKQK